MTNWTAADLPSFAGRTVIITGANSGLGAVTARELARRGATLVMAVRDVGKGEKAALQIRSSHTGQVEVRPLDLQDLSSVRQFAEGVDTVDVLINNAGIMAAPYAQTVDGFRVRSAPTISGISRSPTCCCPNSPTGWSPCRRWRTGRGGSASTT